VLIALGVDDQDTADKAIRAWLASDSLTVGLTHSKISEKYSYPRDSQINL
jgi:hypothetical protein